MIQFFKHIRKSLLIENKPSKYFKYALGEIAFVVIGFLIALQMNNWNKNRKVEESRQGYSVALILQEIGSLTFKTKIKNQLILKVLLKLEDNFSRVFILK